MMTKFHMLYYFEIYIHHKEATQQLSNTLTQRATLSLQLVFYPYRLGPSGDDVDCTDTDRACSRQRNHYNRGRFTQRSTVLRYMQQLFFMVHLGLVSLGSRILF